MSESAAETLTWRPWPGDREDAEGRSAEQDGWRLEVQPGGDEWAWTVCPVAGGRRGHPGAVEDAGGALTREAAQERAAEALRWLGPVEDYKAEENDR